MTGSRDSAMTWIRIALSRHRLLWRLRGRRWPMPDDFDRMSRRQFDALIRWTGFDGRIKAALREDQR